MEEHEQLLFAFATRMDALNQDRKGGEERSANSWQIEKDGRRSGTFGRKRAKIEREGWRAKWRRGWYSCKRSQRMEQRATDATEAADATDATVPRYTAYIIH